MIKTAIFLLFTLLLLNTGYSQDEMYGMEHRLFSSMQGVWEQHIKIYPSPEAPPIEAKGRLTQTIILNGFYLQMSGVMYYEGNKFESMAYMGYDKSVGKYTFYGMDEMSPYPVTALGESNERRTKIEFKGTAVNPQTGEEDSFRIVYSLLTNVVHRIQYFKSDPSGLEYEFMTSDMTLSY